ncbi:MAG: DUF2029 domain-containing protein [Rhizobiales bacterium]|nr:DUF2029 domain-containing protein [Hyphomicrobiales bacterium]
MGRTVLFCWIGYGALLVAATALLLARGHLFGYDHLVLSMPIRPMVGVLVAVGAGYLLVALTFPRVVGSLGRAAQRRLLAACIAFGLLLRLALCFTEPILEDDYQRYLWDGAATAHGLNPYSVAPEDAEAPDAGPLWNRLAREAGAVFERINHPEIRTIYPAVTQAAFAVAYGLAPFDLLGWRALLLLADIATLLLLIALLSALGRSPLWAVLYWLNPLVLKELFNSAHMEGILLPLLLGALLLAVRGREVLASGVLALAVGVKLWPLLLAPLLLRPLLASPFRLLSAIALLAGLCLLYAVPVLLAGLDQTSGFVAYAERWRTNSALSPLLEALAAYITKPLGIDWLTPGRLARGVLALGMAIAALAAARHPVRSPADLLGRAALLTLAILLLSPAQFPWYATWAIVFLPFLPLLGVAALAVTMPLYYFAFQFMARGDFTSHGEWLVWVVWMPIWCLLALELLMPGWRADPALDDHDRKEFDAPR